MNGKRTIKRHTMLLEGSPESIFPLLCPVRESEWIETWQCTMVYSDSGFAEQDCVFRTDFPQDGPRDTWVLSRYERPKLVEFVRVNGIRAIRYTITLARKPKERPRRNGDRSSAGSTTSETASWTDYPMKNSADE